MTATVVKHSHNVVFFNNFFYLYIFKSNDFLVKMGGTSRTS